MDGQCDLGICFPYIHKVYFIGSLYFKFLSTSGDFCYQLLTFVNSLDPDQALQNVGPMQ